jgi:4-hydroxythreonine-4-phosphate dehydrogenase
VGSPSSRRGLRRHPDVSRARKPLVVTAGEPAGIGPDICLAIAESDKRPDFVVIADAKMLQERADVLGIDVRIRSLNVDDLDTWDPVDGELSVIDVPFPKSVRCGSPDPENSIALLYGLRLAAEGCCNGLFSALVTAPLAKNIINDSGVPFTGHTEFLADICDASLPVMLLVAGELRVALATTHMPLRAVPDHLTQSGLRDVINVLHADLQSKFGISDPEIIVCGLNPHAGESGHLGHEDAEVIAPVIDEFRSRGVRVRGPVPADTAFTPAAGHADAVLAMYHDQGLPVLKFASFGHAVNVTLGLPMIRTSVDHGTAFDIAGTGKADAGSLRAAIDLARHLAQVS